MTARECEAIFSKYRQQNTEFAGGRGTHADRTKGVRERRLVRGVAKRLSNSEASWRFAFSALPGHDTNRPQWMACSYSGIQDVWANLHAWFLFDFFPDLLAILPDD
jgi:hypothetical protein